MRNKGFTKKVRRSLNAVLTAGRLTLGVLAVVAVAF